MQLKPQTILYVTGTFRYSRQNVFLSSVQTPPDPLLAFLRLILSLRKHSYPLKLISSELVNQVSIRVKYQIS